MKQRDKVRSPSKRINGKKLASCSHLAKELIGIRNRDISISHTKKRYRKELIDRNPNPRCLTSHEKCYIKNVELSHILPDPKSLMLRGIEKEINEYNLKNCRFSIGVYSWLFKDMEIIKKLIKNYIISDNDIKYILSDI